MRLPKTIQKGLSFSSQGWKFLWGVVLIAIGALVLLSGEQILAMGSERRALSLEQSLEEIQSQDFVFLERGLRRDFFSIQSCLFRGQDVFLVQNYCFPQRSYPARGLTLVSRSFGVLEFYEEIHSGELFREVRLLVFPQDLSGLLEQEPGEMNLMALNHLLEKMSRANLPACWSSDFASSDSGGCYGTDQLQHREWLEEAKAFLRQVHRWPKPPPISEGEPKLP